MKKFEKNSKVFVNNVDFHIQFMTFKYEPVHVHYFYEFVYVLSGELLSKVDNDEYFLKEGSLLFINIGQTHELYAKTDVSYVNILIASEFIEKEVKKEEEIFDIFSKIISTGFFSGNVGLQSIQFENEEKSAFERLIFDMIDEYNRHTVNYEKIFTYDFFVFLLKLSRKTFKYKYRNNMLVVDSKMSKVIEYIDENYDKKLTLEKVAEKFFYNSSYFSRMFKKTFGITFSHYLQDVRIKAAMSIINSTDYSIEMISRLVGYDDKKQFYYTFKKIVGITPGEFRNNVKNETLR